MEKNCHFKTWKSVTNGASRKLDNSFAEGLGFVVNEENRIYNVSANTTAHELAGLMLYWAGKKSSPVSPPSEAITSRIDWALVSRASCLELVGWKYSKSLQLDLLTNLQQIRSFFISMTCLNHTGHLEELELHKEKINSKKVKIVLKSGPYGEWWRYKM
ncbi:hypothetical protein ACROYT_G022188 [Oculina patagonica]